LSTQYKSDRQVHLAGDPPAQIKGGEEEMNIRKGFSALALALLAVTAMLVVGAASAIAAQKLCKKNEKICKAENRYLAGTTVKGTATNTRFTLEPLIGGLPKFVEINCTGATLQVKTKENEGLVELKVTMEVMTFTGCTSPQSETCTVKQIKPTPTGGFIGSETGNGKLETNYEIELNCKNVTYQCVYTSQGAIKALGGNPGVLEAGPEIERVANLSGNCPSVTNWTGKYVLSAPIGEIWFTN
jgi:hypothetical protein